MNSSIKKELLDRENKCNSKVIYEYDRPIINPYEYKDIDTFVKENPFNENSSCKILLPNQEFEKDKYNRYYKNVYTKNRCNALNGYWEEKTLNRDNLNDDGVCWVEQEDGECGNLISDNKILQTTVDKKGQDIKNALNVCNSNSKCSLKKISENMADCISKKRIKIKEDDNDKKPILDILNIETTLYNLYNSVYAPKTLELIGKGDRCNNIMDEEELLQEENKEELDIILEEKQEIEEILEDDKKLNLHDVLTKYYNNYIDYCQLLIISFNPLIKEHIEEIKKFLYKYDDVLFNFFLVEYGIYKAEFNNYYLYNVKTKNSKYKNIEELYYKYFPDYFKRNDLTTEKIKFLFIQNYILLINPNFSNNYNAITKFIVDNSLINDFIHEYNTARTIYTYINFFPNFFNIEGYKENLLNKRKYYHYLQYYIIYITQKRNKNEIIKYLDNPENYSKFVIDYKKNKSLEIFYKYFNNYFISDTSDKYFFYIKNKIMYLDPNIEDDYEELKKYIKDKTLINNYKKYYNLNNNENDEILIKLWKIYFPDFFNDKEVKNDLIMAKSFSSLNSDIDSNNNEPSKLPTVPQSIVNNISKLINEKDLPNRGMLLWHSTGSGKTCTATAIIDGFWTSKKQIIYCSSIDALISNPPFKFHECALNLFSRFTNKSLNQIEREFNQRNVRFLSFAKLANRIEKKEINLNNCVLIIDEVHNLFRPLAHQKKQYFALEKLLLNQKLIPDAKIFILTATLGDNPNEIMKLLNIVKNLNIPEIKFEDIQEPDNFKQKIRGMISYFDMSSDTTKFPTVIHNEPKYIDMSLQQFEKYIIAYNDVKESAKNYEKLAKDNTLNKYWAAARRYSNMLYNYDEGLKLNEFSAKLDTLITTLTNPIYDNQKHYVYSAFYENKGYGGHGILAVAKELIKLGYTKLTPKEAIEIYNNPTEDKKKPRFILAITTQLGNDKGSELESMRKLFNASFNKYGEYVKLFLASQTFNEGLDLKAVRHIHIFEPLITWASDKQTIGRAARYCSHSDLNKKEWDVTIHRYISNLPQIVNEEVKDDTKDILLEIDRIEQKNNKEIIKNAKKNYKKKGITEQEKNILLDEIKIATGELEKLKTLNDQLKLINKQKTKKNKLLNAKDIINIDEFIYKQSIEKMQGILILYQLMQEAAVDCQVLHEFHKQGNNIINCHKY